MSWQKVISSDISQLKDDNEDIVDLFSNKEITLQTAFCKKFDCDFPFDFVHLVWTPFHLERSWNSDEGNKICDTALPLFPDLGESSLNTYCLESTLLFISAKEYSIEVTTEDKLFWLPFEPKFLKKMSLLICEHMLSIICNN